MAIAVNESYWQDKQLRAAAEGYQTNPDGSSKMIADPNPNPVQRNPAGLFARNGGLVITRRLELYEDRMFRFAAKKYLGGDPAMLKTLLNSPWWMNEDRMVLLLERARTTGARLIDIARRQLALPVEWTECDIIVSARTRPRTLLAAHAGRGRTAEGSGANDRFTVAPEAPHLFMDQIYLPGLGPLGGNRAKGQANADAWFDLATVKSYDPAAPGLNPP